MIHHIIVNLLSLFTKIPKKTQNGSLCLFHLLNAFSLNRIHAILNKKVSVAPLIVYRVLFGIMVLFGCLWSISKEDIFNRYLQPDFYFKYYGFEWLGFIGDNGIYVLYLIWFISSLGIVFGALYRISILSFFLCFSYLQLLDASNFINHYYAISIFALFLAFLPANAAFSLDAKRNPYIFKNQIPAWYIYLFQLQVALIYSFAAFAKMNSDWMFSAMPLKIWLMQSIDFPLIGGLFKYHSVHLLFSWIALIFDLTIVWWLLIRKTRKFAYAVVLVFHIVTGLLLNIGLFPVLMIFTTALFFEPQQHAFLLSKIGIDLNDERIPDKKDENGKMKYIFLFHFAIQIILPLRHHFLYSGNPLWTEEGYRFSWRVMLLEKEGVATFYVKDPDSELQWEVTNSEFLTGFQEKRMSVRPDHIIQYAHFLDDWYSKKFNLQNPEIYADVFVSLNGRVSQRLIDNSRDLSKVKVSLWQNDCILPFSE